MRRGQRGVAEGREDLGLSRAIEEGDAGVARDLLSGRHRVGDDMMVGEVADGGGGEGCAADQSRGKGEDGSRAMHREVFR